MSARLDVSMTLSVGGRGGQDRFDLSLAFEEDVGVLAFFGPSGAGKTLALRALAGLLRPAEGHLTLEGETWADTATGTWVPPHSRGVGYVPQNGALFDHLTVLQNVCFGLRAQERRRPPARVLELMERLGLGGLGQGNIHRLSGGERQRVALARALARAPRLLLLDEPMSALDEAARQVLRRLLLETIADLGVPTILVTHDPHEARALAQSVLLFRRGESGDVVAPETLGR
jgi:molybdate transport system ATP-binding protein